jgi:hypothetical protein
MTTRRSLSVAAGAAALVGLLGTGYAKQPQPRRFAVILQADADRHEGLARALHALLYAEELKGGGHEVVLILDGAGTSWAPMLRDPSHKLHARWERLRKAGVVEEVCDFCAGAFKVKDGLKTMTDANLVAEFEGHPSLLKWVDQGYEVLVL